ncbi:MAG: hypothetical protein ABI690_27615 [Chloroflexota bacterium]
MTEQNALADIIEQMKASPYAIEFDPGLSDAEIESIETACEFQFPPDLRMFLQLGIPRRTHYKERIDENFPNWRENPAAIMNSARELALVVFLVDIEHSEFWMEAWGTRPPELADAFRVAKSFIQAAPLLIPIYAHRFLPALPNLAGNPVFSVWQAQDTIYFGYSLVSYLRNEFLSTTFEGEDWGQPSDYRFIPLWSTLAGDKPR